jgi:beta-phosphoglucomutase-like phosphatase (HAD superfamily)
MNLSSLEAICWDFDGVILDSTGVKDEAFQAMFSPFGPETLARVLRHHRENGGISRVEKIACYYREFVKQPLSEAELELKCKEFADRVVERVIAADWIAGTEPFLERYHSQVPMFVISGTPQAELELIIARRRMARFFKGVLGSPRHKPDHIRDLLARYGFASDRCLFIGDAMTDYRAARETGLRFIGIQKNTVFPPGTTVVSDGTFLEGAIQSLSA